MIYQINDYWLTNANIGYLKAKYDQFDTTFNGVQGDYSNTLDPINAPEITAGLGLEYQRNIGAGRVMSVGGNLSYSGKYFVEVNNLDELEQAGFALLNLSAGISDEKGIWDVRLGIKNVTDKKYITHGFDLTAFPGVGLAYYGAPRTTTLSATYRF